MATTKHRATIDEIGVRRAEVVRLRFTGMSEPEIAGQLRVSSATVCRDLQAIQQTWGDQLGKNFDAKNEVAEALGLFELLEAAAVRELAKLESHGYRATASRMKCLSAARTMRSARIDLLAGIGFLGPSLPTTNIPNAASIRLALRDARASERNLISPAERRTASSDKPTV
jgi:transposase